MNSLEHKKITRLSGRCAVLLLQYGADSKLIEETIVNLGKTLGLEVVDIAIAPRNISLTTGVGGEYINFNRQTVDVFFNMALLSEVLRIIQQLINADLAFSDVERKIKQMRALRYPKVVLVPMLAVACACVASLNGASFQSFLVVLITTGLTVYLHLFLISRQCNQLLNINLTAFACISIVHLLLKVPYLDESTNIVFAASMLFILPIFQLINAVSDFSHRYNLTGLSYLTSAITNLLATFCGIIAAIYLWSIPIWV